MRDPKLTSKNFNPYDLGAVAKLTKEFRSGYYRAGHSEPYIPPRLKQDEALKHGEDQPEGTRKKA